MTTQNRQRTHSTTVRSFGLIGGCSVNCRVVFELRVRNRDGDVGIGRARSTVANVWIMDHHEDATKISMRQCSEIQCRAPYNTINACVQEHAQYTINCSSSMQRDTYEGKQLLPTQAHLCPFPIRLQHGYPALQLYAETQRSSE